jgi:hypothetical protein
MNALTHRLERFALGIGLALALIVGYVAIAAATPAGAASGSSWNMISAYPAGSFGAIVTNPANGDIITVGDDGAVQVIAGSDGTRYGLSMTTGDTYIVAQDVGDEIATSLSATATTSRSSRSPPGVSSPSPATGHTPPAPAVRRQQQGEYLRSRESPWIWRRATSSSRTG